MDHRMSRKRRVGGNHSSHLLRWGLTAAAAYGTYHVARWTVTSILNRFKDDLEDEEIERQRMLEVAAEVGLSVSDETGPSQKDGSPTYASFSQDETNLLAAQEDTVTIMKDLVPTLRAKIESITDCTSEIQRMKQIRKGRRETNHGPNKATNIESDPEENRLWEAIKCKSITRFLLWVYAFNNLLILVYTETNCLQRMDLSEETREETRYALISNTFQTYIDAFIPHMQQRIEHAIMKRLKCWNVIQITDIGVEEFTSGLSSVRWNVEAAGSTILKHLKQSFLKVVDNVPNENAVVQEIMIILSKVYETPYIVDVWKEGNEYWFGYAYQQCINPLFSSSASSTTSDLEEKTLVAVLRGLKECTRVFETNKEKCGVAEEQKNHYLHALRSFICADKHSEMPSLYVKRLLALIPQQGED